MLVTSGLIRQCTNLNVMKGRHPNLLRAFIFIYFLSELNVCLPRPRAAQPGIWRFSVQMRSVSAAAAGGKKKKKTSQRNFYLLKILNAVRSSFQKWIRENTKYLNLTCIEPWRECSLHLVSLNNLHSTNRMQQIGFERNSKGRHAVLEKLSKLIKCIFTVSIR